jgi:twitching motility two-component system response regulator PilH
MNTIMVVDDNAVVREMLSEQLKGKGFQVVLAKDGVEAMEQLQASRPDLVITDLVMPRMNGYELCRWIKNNSNFKDLPVIMCTSKSEEFDRYWGMKQGADAYITKPYHPPELIDAVKKLLK